MANVQKNMINASQLFVTFSVTKKGMDSNHYIHLNTIPECNGPTKNDGLPFL